jgi:hypothetical protein
LKILTANLPFSDEQVLDYVTKFLQRAHGADERYTVRDGINVARYALKLMHGNFEVIEGMEETEGLPDMEHAVRSSISRVLGEDALRHLP